MHDSRCGLVIREYQSVGYYDIFPSSSNEYDDLRNIVRRKGLTTA